MTDKPSKAEQRKIVGKKATGVYEIHGNGIRDLLESHAWLWVKLDIGVLDQLVVDEENTTQDDNLIDNN